MTELSPISSIEIVENKMGTHRFCPWKFVSKSRFDRFLSDLFFVTAWTRRGMNAGWKTHGFLFRKSGKIWNCLIQFFFIRKIKNKLWLLKFTNANHKLDRICNLTNDNSFASSSKLKIIKKSEKIHMHSHKMSDKSILAEKKVT